MLRPMIVYYTDRLDAVEEVMRLAGFTLDEDRSDAHWRRLVADGSVLALHQASEAHPSGTADHSLVSTMPLDEFRAESARWGVDVEYVEEPWGTSAYLRLPDGNSMQVNF